MSDHKRERPPPFVVFTVYSRVVTILRSHRFLLPRFFQCLNSLVGCGLGGPTSPLAFGEAVLGAVDRRASSVANKEHVWRMWSAVVTPLTDAVTQVRPALGCGWPASLVILWCFGKMMINFIYIAPFIL